MFPSHAHSCSWLQIEPCHSFLWGKSCFFQLQHITRFTCPLMVTIVDIQREVVDLGRRNSSANKVLVLQARGPEFGPSTYITNRARWRMLAIPELGSWRQADLRDLMANQPSWVCNPQASQKTRKSIQVITSKVSLWPPYAYTYMNIHTHNIKNIRSIPSHNKKR